MKTEFIALSGVTEETDKLNISRAAACLRSGGLVVFPTETVYGLGGDATDWQAAEKIYAAKGRPADNPLIIHIAEPYDAERYAVTSELYYRLAEAFMPGPLTVVMEARATVPSTVTAGLTTVAVRCPAHPIAHALIKATGRPIAAPSANLSGSPSPTSAAHVLEDMDGRVDMILDGGESAIGLESTIVKPEPDGSLTLLRPGAITPEDLKGITDRVNVADAVLGMLKKGEPVLSPGMKYKHYAPKTEFVLYTGDPLTVEAFLKDLSQSAAVFTYDEDVSRYSSLSRATLIPIGPRQEPAVLAHRLFYLLRDADKQGYSVIYAPLPAPNGLGLALYNRMIRAAAHNIITL